MGNARKARAYMAGPDANMLPWSEDVCHRSHSKRLKRARMITKLTRTSTYRPQTRKILDKAVFDIAAVYNKVGHLRHGRNLP